MQSERVHIQVVSLVYHTTKKELDTRTEDAQTADKKSENTLVTLRDVKITTFSPAKEYKMAIEDKE